MKKWQEFILFFFGSKEDFKQNFKMEEKKRGQETKYILSR